MRHKYSNVNFPAIMFKEGINYRSYEYFGVHKGREKYSFRIWQPDAEKVFLVLYYKNGPLSFPMNKITDDGIWELFIHTTEHLDAKYICDDPEGIQYNYDVIIQGKSHYVNDPFAVCFSSDSDKKSVVRIKSKYLFDDSLWALTRFHSFLEKDSYQLPLNICKVDHIFDNYGQISFKSIAKTLIPYVKKAGYTHVLLPPIFDFDGTYNTEIRPSSLYSINSSLGDIDDLKNLVDKLHNVGVGVILDFTPFLFSARGQDPSPFGKACLSDNNALAYDVGKKEVISYLISSAFYWFDKFHIDGLHVTQSGGLMDLNFGKEKENWTANRYGGFENLEGLFFLNQLNEAIKKEYSDRLIIADDNRIFGKTVIDKFNKNLGFSFRIKTDWCEDFHNYIFKDTKNLSGRLPMENYILPLSLKAAIENVSSIFDFDGLDLQEKLGFIRAVKVLQMTLPYKKLGSLRGDTDEIEPLACSGSATDAEWADRIRRYQCFVEHINKVYSDFDSFYDNDLSSDGMKFINTGKTGLIAFTRRSRKGKEPIIVINFLKESIEGLVLPSKITSGFYKTVLNSNEKRFGGSGGTVFGRYRIRSTTRDFRVDVPPFGALILAPEGDYKPR